MKNLIGLILLFSISMPVIQAQEIMVGAHTGIPVGAFASDDINDGAFAKSGYGINVESYSRFDSWPEKIYLALLFSYQVNELDGNAVGEAFNEELPNGATALVSRTKYRPLSIMLGPLYRYQLSEKFSLDFKVSAGMMISNVDPFTLKIFDNQENLIANEEFVFSSKPVFSYGLGLNAGYDLNDRFGIKLYINYASGKEKLTGSGIDDEQRISSINTGLAIAVKFD